MKKELRLGIIILLTIYPLSSRFLNLPDVILGFLMGLGLIFTVMGLLPEKTYFKIKKTKTHFNK